MAKTDPWLRIKKQTDDFDQKLSDLLNRIKSAFLALGNVIESTYSEVHNPRGGEDGSVHMEEFDHSSFEKSAKTSLDVLLIQEMCNIFGLEKSVKSRVISAYINRHQYLRPLQPRVASPGSQSLNQGRQFVGPEERSHPKPKVPRKGQ
jgi:hypothetical protein